MNFVTVKIGYSELDPITHLPTIQALNPIEGDSDFENFGQTAYYGPIGLTSLPYQASDDGYCEGLVVRDVAGLNGALVGYRDDRSATIYGQLSPGDTCVHSTGPNLAAQLLLKEERKQAALITKDSNGKDVGISIDGTDNSITIFGFGCAIKLSSEGINLAAGSYSIQLTSDGKFLANAAQGYLGGAAVALNGIVYGLHLGAEPAGLNVFSTSWFVQP